VLHPHQRLTPGYQPLRMRLQLQRSHHQQQQLALLLLVAWTLDQPSLDEAWRRPLLKGHHLQLLCLLPTVQLVSSRQIINPMRRRLLRWRRSHLRRAVLVVGMVPARQPRRAPLPRLGYRCSPPLRLRQQAEAMPHLLAKQPTTLKSSYLRHVEVYVMFVAWCRCNAVTNFVY